MAKQSKSIAKYFQHYAEAEVQALQEMPVGQWQQVLLIPAYKESADFLVGFVEQFRHLRVLLILVINQPQSDTQHTPQQQLWDRAASTGLSVWQHQNLQLVNCADSGVDLLLVDRFSGGRQIPVKQGVGLARKIGADIACWLINQDCVANPQIYSTDADAALPDDYFSHSQLTQRSSAGVFDFVHTEALAANAEKVAVSQATQLYEQRLHYYVNGLCYAGSLYAFHTIGSCLTFDYVAYCQVRGFPKKSGGEDFYLLNKLAKTGKVDKLSPCIEIRARLSDRVPFGTGPAVSDIVARDLNEEDYLVYHPQIFVTLKNLLSALQTLCLQEGHIDTFRDAVDDASCTFLKEAGFFQQWPKWQKQHRGQSLLWAVNHWFDAFRTLKYVHFQRDRGLQDISLKDARRKQARLWQ